MKIKKNHQLVVSSGGTFELRSGVLRVYQQVSEDREGTFNLLFPGDIFRLDLDLQYEALMESEIRIAEVDAGTYAVHLETLLERAYQFNVMRQFTLRGRIERLLEMLSRTELIRHSENGRRLFLSHQKVSELIGAIRESVSKVIMEMIHEHVAYGGYGYINFPPAENRRRAA